jgi:hypothetical protein
MPIAGHCIRRKFVQSHPEKAADIRTIERVKLPPQAEKAPEPAKRLGLQR